MSRGMIRYAAVLLLACGGGGDDDGGDDGGDGTDDGQEPDAGPVVVADAGPTAERDTCTVTVTGDLESGVEPMTYVMYTDANRQYFAVGDSVNGREPIASMTCFSASGGLPPPGTTSNRVSFDIFFRGQMWSDIELPFTSQQMTGPVQGSAVFERTTDPDPAPVEFRTWNCSALIGDNGTGDSNWTITDVRPNVQGLDNLNRVLVDGEFHGICVPAADDPINQAQGTVTIDAVF